ncbi:hypothetical protein GGR51DRAFT_557108 [Nemania sp. FL0031]|nr:hypothetical protein GGR51DRAFT_557108 [Nemania sp. FL0031]
MRMRTSVKLISLVISQSLSSSRSRYVAAQVIEDDSIVYTTVSGWEDMRACARCPFRVTYNICGAGDFVNDAIGCVTNACLCRASTLEQAIEFVDEKVLSLCSNYDDQSTASEFLLRYCSTHGYTSVGTAATPTVSSETTTSQTSSHSIEETFDNSQSESSPTSNPSSPETSTPSSPITSPPPTSSTISNPSPTNSASSTTQSNNDGLQTSDLIGIIVGVLSLFVAVLT